MNLYDKLLGNHWVYEYIRPFVVGGLNSEIAYECVECCSEDIIVDVGCGMGAALNHLQCFRQYHGFDPDKRAIKRLSGQYQKDNIFIYNRVLTVEDILRIKPQKIILIGLLHHLREDEILELWKILSLSDSIRRVITLDPMYIKGKPLNNFLAFFDRGKYVRTKEIYEALMKKSPFILFRIFHIQSGNKLASYFMADLRSSEGI
jgi:SAM-dependent methyltransferase